MVALTKMQEQGEGDASATIDNSKVNMKVLDPSGHNVVTSTKRGCLCGQKIAKKKKKKKIAEATRMHNEGSSSLDHKHGNPNIPA
jgi:hypothetical protein